MAAFVLLLFGVPFAGALAGSFVAARARRRMSVSAKGVGDIYTVEVQADTADAEKAIAKLATSIDGVVRSMEKLNGVADKVPAGTLTPSA